MALINKLRNKAGTWIVAAVGVAILSFVLADVLGPGSSLFGGQDNSVGEIAGQTIKAPEYQNAIELMTQKFTLRNGRRPSDVESNSIREQAWERMIADIAFSEQFQELGVEVTREEEVDMVQGKNIHPDLVAAFTDPSTGQFDQESIIQFLSNLNNFPPETQAAWYSMEDDILAGRRRIKYDNLLVKSSYATQEESKRTYQEQTEVAELKYLYIPYYAVGDSAVTVSDSELSQYLDDRKQEYTVEESRALKYVTFSIQPSALDSADFQTELQSIKEDFERRTDDSVFARTNTEIGSGYNSYTVDMLPLILQSDFENLSIGSVYGPFTENGYYNLYKISDIVEDTIMAARAKHILFKWANNSIEAKEDARAEAQKVLQELKLGADFAEKALIHGTDGTASQGGDLGWFRSGAMVAEFQDAVFDASAPGLLPELVETQFGYHIISVTNNANNQSYKVATVGRELLPSDKTRDEAYRKADIFRSKSDDLESFETTATEDGLNTYDATNVDKNARRFGTLGNARQIVSWLFREASEGRVSDVYEIDDNYVVAVMTSETEKGTATLEDVRNEVTLKVKNQKKAQLIIDKLSGLEGDLDQMASAYGTDATVYNTSDLKLSSNSIPNVGFAPAAVGKAFALEPGERTAPMESENGVLIMELISKTPAPEIADYTLYKQQVTQQLENRTSFNVSNAIKESAGIEDRRYKFY